MIENESNQGDDPRSSGMARIEAAYREYATRLGALRQKLAFREFEICILIVTGLTTGEIADVLHISEQGIHRHRYSLRRRLGVPKETRLKRFLESIASSD